MSSSLSPVSDLDQDSPEALELPAETFGQADQDTDALTDAAEPSGEAELGVGAAAAEADEIGRAHV